MASLCHHMNLHRPISLHTSKMFQRRVVPVSRDSLNDEAKTGSWKWKPARTSKRPIAVPALMCGVIGILLADRDAQVSQELYDGLTILQHRGQDAAGIATSDGRKIHLRKNKGLVRLRDYLS